MLNASDGLKRIRKDKKILQKDIASFLSLPLKTYQLYEYGEAMPSLETLDKLADHSDISLDCRKVI